LKRPTTELSGVAAERNEMVDRFRSDEFGEEEPDPLAEATSDSNVELSAQITEEQWIARATKRFEDRAGMGREEAMEYAKTCFDAEESDSDRTPEEAIDDELDEWAQNQ
jgi:hypothetical protein